MNPPPNSTEQSGGVNFGSGNQAAVNDVIGRDKVVHNHYSPLPTGPQIPKPPGAARLRGRAELLDELAACLPSIPLLALEGLPGVGKSSLALALANHPLVIEQFPHGRLWLEFGPEANVYDLLGRALLLFGQPLEALREQAERQARLQQLLADQQCLLLLDDLWQVGQAQPFLLATSASTRVVMTLRRASLAADLGAHCRSVPTLSNSAAQAMLGDGGPSAQQAVAMAPAAATALSKTLGHLPLALHVVARRLNRLAHSRGASGAVARLQAEVAQGTDQLLQLRAAQPRLGIDGIEPTLAAVLALSYDHLPNAATQSALRQLAVFGAQPYSFSIAAMAAVWQSVNEASSDALLLALDESGLLSQSEPVAGQVPSTGEPRYLFHPIVQRFVAARLASDPAEQEQAYLAHAAHYAQVVAGWDDAVRSGGMTYAVPLEWEQVARAVNWLCSLVESHDTAARQLLGFSQHWRNQQFSI